MDLSYRFSFRDSDQVGIRERADVVENFSVAELRRGARRYIETSGRGRVNRMVVELIGVQLHDAARLEMAILTK